MEVIAQQVEVIAQQVEIIAHQAYFLKNEVKKAIDWGEENEGFRRVRAI